MCWFHPWREATPFKRLHFWCKRGVLSTVYTKHTSYSINTRYGCLYIQNTHPGYTYLKQAHPRHEIDSTDWAMHSINTRYGCLYILNTHLVYTYLTQAHPRRDIDSTGWAMHSINTSNNCRSMNSTPNWHSSAAENVTYIYLVWFNPL